MALGSIIIRDVHLPQYEFRSTTQLYDVTCEGGIIVGISAARESADDPPQTREELPTELLPQWQIVDGEQGLLLPALCHAHIHLDKCFLLDKCDELLSGDFPEALKVTAKAKTKFPSDLRDLYERGRRLIVESVECGVTSMRAHVEVDRTVQMCCLEVGLQLSTDFSSVCDVQIAVFAQDPIFDSPEADLPGENFTLLRSAAARVEVQAVGSAPYVESTVAHAKRNIELILDLAFENSLHADFHLDYNLDPASEPLIWFVLDQLRDRIRSGKWHTGMHVCVGHATRLSLFSAEEWGRFSRLVQDEGLPVTLVGLPPSDLYMMGRDLPKAPRSTLDVPELARDFGLQLAMSVNNIENAFTPQGPVDPLALCPLGVAIFQAGTPAACMSLLRSQ